MGPEDLVAVWRAAVAACDPRRVVREACERLGTARPRVIVAVGKAAGAMAAGAVDVFGACDGIVVTVDGVSVPETGLRLRRASHPEPDARSEAAGREVMAMMKRVPAGEVALVLVSGGASALCAVPRHGLALDEKVRRVREVMQAGAPIAELNRVRKELSAIKGGKLAALCPGRVVTLVVSDVPGDDVAVVGSGPTVPGKPGDEVHLVAGIDRFRREAAKSLSSSGDGVNFDNISDRSEVLEGDVAAVAMEIGAVARRLKEGEAWVAGGEWTVKVTGKGRGGRATHLALLAAIEIAGIDGMCVLVAGSDGNDGTGPWAGAVVDGETRARMVRAGVDEWLALATCDSGSALDVVGATIDGGPTGVNHADLVIVARE